MSIIAKATIFPTYFLHSSHFSITLSCHALGMAETAPKYYLLSQTRIGGIIPVSRLKPFNPATLKEPRRGFAYTYGDERRVMVSQVPHAPDTLHIVPLQQHLKPITARGYTLHTARVQVSIFPGVREHIIVRRKLAA